jgi:RimJ/RimL family protein N-acetyltransferase
MLNILKVNFEDIIQSRNAYLGSLHKFQDIHIEFKIQCSSYYKLNWNDKVAGYFIISSNNVLLEFYLNDKYVLYASKFLEILINDFQFPHVYCKSFDFTLLNSYFVETDHQDPIELTIRYATSDDLPFLHQQSDEVFEPKDLLSQAIENKGIIFFHKKENLIGCGFLTVVHPNWNYYDVGVWICPENRMQGYGVQIINYLKNSCLQNGWIPIVGCDINNIASQKTIHKAGFISKYSLLEFTTT